MLRKLDDLLNKITMYALVAWGLRVLATISIIFSLTGILDIPVKGMLLSLVILAVSCFATNEILSRLWKVPTNSESYAITLLILFFIMPQATTLERGLLLAAAGILAIASKFLVNYNGRHIFNPAAFGAVVLGLLGLMQASWWVGNEVMWPILLVFGLLVVRKIRRFSMFLTFVGASLLTFAVVAALDGQDGQEVAESLRYVITSSPLLFLGTIMLTEPSTMPARRYHQMIFGALVGVMYATPLTIGSFIVLPETALILGNLYAFAVNPRYRLKLRLREVRKVSERVSDYIFTPDRKAAFEPGQYMEWTLLVPKPDLRGNRRTFSIASSPTEADIHLGVKFYEPSSAFKTSLRAMKPGDTVYAGQIAGDFVLPADTSQKLVFVAAGIGITPFRGMLKYIVDKGEKRDIVMIYAISDATELAYTDVLKAARQHGVRVIPLLTSETIPQTWKGSTGRLSAEYLKAQIPDYKDRIIYISGPNGLVQNLRADLIKSGVNRTLIKTDYFTGY